MTGPPLPRRRTRSARGLATMVSAAARGAHHRPLPAGQLRALVAAHLGAYPGSDFSPYEIAQALRCSHGAVANACARLVSLGQARLTQQAPRRYQAAGTPPPESEPRPA